jgi:replicative DNA helicase
MPTEPRASRQPRLKAEPLVTAPVQVTGGRVPPQNIDAEISTLGALLIDGDAIMRIADLLRPDDFYRPDHGQIFAAALALFEKRTPIDMVTVSGELERLKQLEDVGGMAKLSALVSSVATAANVEHYAKIVREKATLRKLIQAAGEIGEMAFHEERDVDQVLDTAERTLFSVTQRFLKQNFHSVRSILDDSFERLGMLANQEAGMRGIPTGFRQLDRLLGGMQRSDLLILAARPSMGKCVIGETKVLNPQTGERVTIKQLVAQKQGKVATLNSEWKLETTSPSHFVADGFKPTFKVVTALGHEIEATAVHPLLTVTGWKKVQDLQSGDRIAVPRSLPFFGTQELPEHEVKALAYFLSDGGTTNRTPRFTNVNPTIVADFKSAMSQFPQVTVRGNNSGGTRAMSYTVAREAGSAAQQRQVWSAEFARAAATQPHMMQAIAKAVGVSASTLSHWRSGACMPKRQTAVLLHQSNAAFPLPTTYSQENPVTLLLKKHGIQSKLAREKSVPEAIFTLSKPQIALFLNRIFSCDGTAHLSVCGGAALPCVSYSTVSFQLAEDVQHLLRRFGILARCRKRQVRYNGALRPAYEVELRGSADILTFAREIGILGKERQLQKVVQLCQTRRAGWTKDTVPIEIWEKILARKGARSWKMLFEAKGLPAPSNLHAGKRAPRRESLALLAHVLDDPELHALASSEVYWDRIVSITPTGIKEVFDLTVPGTHNFVANDIVVHNTALALNIAEHAAVQEKKTVGMFSLEMSKEQLVDRLMSSLGRVDAWKLRNGQLSEDDMSSLIQAQAQLAEANLFIDDAPMASIMEVRAKARRLQAEHGLDLIIIDYLQLMQGSARNQENRVQEVSEISRSLKALAKELNCPVMALSQLSRAVEARNDKRPMLSDLRESGSIEQDADVVMFLYRDDYYNKERNEHNNLLEVIVSKHRNGPTGEAKLSAQLAHGRFYDIDLRHHQG